MLCPFAAISLMTTLLSWGSPTPEVPDLGIDRLKLMTVLVWGKLETYSIRPHSVEECGSSLATPHSVGLRPISNGIIGRRWFMIIWQWQPQQKGVISSKKDMEKLFKLTPFGCHFFFDLLRGDPPKERSLSQSWTERRIRPIRFNFVFKLCCMRS